MTETSGQVIDRIAKENKVDPSNPYFRAELMKRLVASGYFKSTNNN